MHPLNRNLVRLKRENMGSYIRLTFKKLFKNLELYIFVMHALNRNLVKLERESIGSYMRLTFKNLLKNLES